MAGAPIVGSSRSSGVLMFTVTWWENGRRLTQEFATRDAARRNAKAIAARQQAEKKR